MSRTRRTREERKDAERICEFFQKERERFHINCNLKSVSRIKNNHNNCCKSLRYVRAVQS